MTRGRRDLNLSVSDPPKKETMHISWTNQMFLWCFMAYDNNVDGDRFYFAGWTQRGIGARQVLRHEEARNLFVHGDSAWRAKSV